eukprot:scpid79212/ scgid31299/ 
MKVVTNVGHHSHASEPGRKEVLEVRDGMVKRSRETMDSSHQIVSGSLSTVSRTAACQLPSQKSLKRALQRERVRAGNGLEGGANCNQHFARTNRCRTRWPAPEEEVQRNRSSAPHNLEQC